MTCLTAFSRTSVGSIPRHDIDYVAEFTIEHLSSYGPHTSETWTSPDGLTTLLRVACTPSGICHGEEGALTYAGYWVNSAYGSNLHLLQALERADDPNAVVSRLGGSFVLMFYSSQRGCLMCWNTIACSPPMFGARIDGGSVVSTRQAMILRCASFRQAGYTPESIVAFTALGRHFGVTGAGNQGITLAEPMTRFQCERGELHATVYDDQWNAYGYGEEELTDGALDEMAGSLVESIQNIAATYGTLRLGLSGGRDSRLLAATLHASGVAWVANTSGWDDHPDVILARRIAHTLDVPLQVSASLPPEPLATFDVDLGRNLLRSTAKYDGMHSPLAVAPTNTIVRESHSVRGQSISVGGNPGECLRGGQAILVYGYDRNAIRSLDDALRKIRASYMTWRDYFHADAFDAFHLRMDQWVHDQFDESFPHAIFERIYLYWFRTRFSPVDGGYTIYPLADSAVLRHAHRFRFESRFDERLVFELVRRLAPAISDIPTAERRWGFERDAPAPAYEDGYEKRKPLPLQSTGRTGNPIYYQSGTQLRDPLRRIIHDPRRMSYVSQAIDEDRVVALLRGRDLFNPSNCLLLWNIFGAQMITSQDWLDWQHSCEVPVPVNLDVQWNAVFLYLTDVLEKYRSLSQPVSLPRMPKLRSPSVRVLPAPQARCEIETRGAAISVSVDAESAGRWIVCQLGDGAELAGRVISLSFSSIASTEIFGSAHFGYDTPHGTHRTPWPFVFDTGIDNHQFSFVLPAGCAPGPVEFWAPLLNRRVDVSLEIEDVSVAGECTTPQEHVRQTLATLKSNFKIDEENWRQFRERSIDSGTIGEFLDEQMNPDDPVMAVYSAIGIDDSRPLSTDDAKVQ